MICLADLVVALIRTRMGKEMELEKMMEAERLTDVFKLEAEIDLLNSLVESLVN